MKLLTSMLALITNLISCGELSIVVIHFIELDIRSRLSANMANETINSSSKSQIV